MHRPIVRGDLSNKLVHLTRADPPVGATGPLTEYIIARNATQAFLSILQGCQLLGSSRDIRGGDKCVCFSEAPISVIAQMLSDKQSRYAPYGVIVDKVWLFGQGGRPVIYQPEAEFDLLPEVLRYRHVRYEPHESTDYSWEREWRIKIDRLILHPGATTFVVPSRVVSDSLKDGHTAQLCHEVWAAGDAAIVEPFPWHFLALEDLGVEIDFG